MQMPVLALWFVLPKAQCHIPEDWAVHTAHEAPCADSHDIFCGTSCYKILGVPEGTADQRLIKSAFRKMAMRYHPAYNWNTVLEYDRTVTAYEVLTKENVRQVYDSYLANPEGSLLSKYSSYWMVMSQEYMREIFLDLLARLDVYAWPIYLAFVALDSSSSKWLICLLLAAVLCAIAHKLVLNFIDRRRAGAQYACVRQWLDVGGMAAAAG